MKSILFVLKFMIFTLPPQQAPMLQQIESEKIAVNWKHVPDVAQYKQADWNNLVKKVSGVTVEEAKRIAEDDPKITFFFYVKGGRMVLENDFLYRVFHHGDAVFFSGKPWYGSAPGLADAYEKQGIFLGESYPD